MQRIKFTAMAAALAPILKTLRQKTFYADPRFHASFAWALLDQHQSHSAPCNNAASARDRDRDDNARAPPDDVPVRIPGTERAPSPSPSRGNASPSPSGDLRAPPSPSGRTEPAILKSAQARVRSPETEAEKLTELGTGAFPEDLVRALNEQLGAKLVRGRAGVFRAQEVCVRVGKEVSGWTLGRA